MAVTFSLNKIFQTCFEILKDNRKIFNLNSVFLLIQKSNPKWRVKNEKNLFFRKN